MVVRSVVPALASLLRLQASDWFQHLGFPMPYGVNAADFILDCAMGEVLQVRQRHCDVSWLWTVDAGPQPGAVAVRGRGCGCGYGIENMGRGSLRKVDSSRVKAWWG